MICAAYTVIPYLLTISGDSSQGLKQSRTGFVIFAVIRCWEYKNLTSFLRKCFTSELLAAQASGTETTPSHLLILRGHQTAATEVLLHKFCILDGWIFGYKSFQCFSTYWFSIHQQSPRRNIRVQTVGDCWREFVVGKKRQKKKPAGRKFSRSAVFKQNNNLLIKYQKLSNLKNPVGRKCARDFVSYYVIGQKRAWSLEYRFDKICWNCSEPQVFCWFL